MVSAQKYYMLNIIMIYVKVHLEDLYEY